ISQSLKTAPALAYAYTELRNYDIEDDNSLTINMMTSHLVEGMPKPLPGRSPTQPQPPTPVTRVPNADAFYSNDFIPTSSELLGCVEEPIGRPICAGGFSDVWRCNIRFWTPSEALPTE
ncbi:hypothetical protein FRC01_014735, partial [Tulasnella sp. 417]